MTSVAIVDGHVAIVDVVDDEACDLRNQDGADRFRAKVEELNRKRQSKLTEMAEANQSGNGVMPQRPERSDEGKCIKPKSTKG